MADNSEEISVINHLLKVEKEAYSLIDDAMKEAEKQVSSARAASESEFREKYAQVVTVLEADYKKNLDSLTESHNSLFGEYKTNLTNLSQNKDAFNGLLDKLLFASEQ